MNESTESEVMHMLANLIANADSTYVFVGKHSFRLSDPKLPDVERARFFRDRMNEVIRG